MRHRTRRSHRVSRGRLCRSLFVDAEVLRAFPKREPTDLHELCVAFDDRREVVPGKLPHLAREHRRAVREQDLHLREAARIDEHLARRRVARVIFEIDPEPLLPHRDPGRFAAPPAMDKLASQREELPDRGARPRRVLLLEPRFESERSGRDAEHRHRGRTIPAARWRPSPRTSSTRRAAARLRVWPYRSNTTARSSPVARPTAPAVSLSWPGRS